MFNFYYIYNYYNFIIFKNVKEQPILIVIKKKMIIL